MNTTKHKKHQNQSKRYKTRKRIAREYGKQTIGTPIGFPTETIYKMRYCTEFDLTGGATGGMAVKNFYANGLFQPEVTPGSGAHQPMGWDQALKYYQYGVVLGSKITIKLQAKGVTEEIPPIMYGVFSRENGGTIYTDWTGMKEAGYPAKMSGPLPAVPFTCSTGFSAKKIYGEDHQVLQSYGNYATANANFLQLFSVWLQAVDLATQTDTFICVATIDYIVKCYTRNTLVQS